MRCSVDLSLRYLLANVLFNKGVHLTKLQRVEEAHGAFDGLVRSFGESERPSIRESVALALLAEACLLVQTGRTEDAITACDELVHRFGGDPDLTIRERVADALFIKGRALEDVAATEQWIAIYDELIGQLAEGAELSQREQAASLGFFKGYRLGKVGRHEQAVARIDRNLLGGVLSSLPDDFSAACQDWLTFLNGAAAVITCATVPFSPPMWRAPRARINLRFCARGTAGSSAVYSSLFKGVALL